MADMHHKPGTPISKVQRQLTVGYISINHTDRHTGASRYYSRSPVLNLKSNWLQEAGFNYRQPVTVTVEQGRLIISLAGTE